MATQLEIANASIVLVGALPLTAYSGTKKSFITVNALWNITRDACLRMHPWNFAMAREELYDACETPAYEWDYAFDLPEDCVRVIGTEHDEYTDIKWKVEGKQIVTNETSMIIKYISNAKEIADWDTLFVNYFIAALAEAIAYPLVQSRSIMEVMRDLATKRLREAKGVDAQEGTTDEMAADKLLDSRIV